MAPLAGIKLVSRKIKTYKKTSTQLPSSFLLEEVGKELRTCTHISEIYLYTPSISKLLILYRLIRKKVFCRLDLDQGNSRMMTTLAGVGGYGC
jgi:hypothetical protein